MAESKSISLNALVIMILTDYTEVWRWSNLLESIMLARSTVAKLVDCCSESDLIEIAEISGSTVTQSFLRTAGIVPIFYSVVNSIEHAGTKTHWFKFSQHMREQKLFLHLRHNLSRNWSIFLAHQIATVFKTILGREVKFEILDNSVTITVKLKQVERGSI